MTEPHILMCPPDYFGIEYEINPWMSRAHGSDHQLATEQWLSLKTLIQESGAHVSAIDPVSGLPDLVFTANAGLVYRDQVLLSHFKHRQRQGEIEHFQSWFRQHGFDVLSESEGTFFEGAGDALFCGENLFAGYRIRSDAVSHQRVAQELDCRVLILELTDPYYYHLDTCFCPLSFDTAIYYPGAFDSYGRQVIEEFVENPIPVHQDEAKHFACNAVVLGSTVITNTGCERLHRDLRKIGYQPIGTSLSEFVKSGGSAKCLTLRLDGEDAASWRTAQKKATRHFDAK